MYCSGEHFMYLLTRFLCLFLRKLSVIVLTNTFPENTECTYNKVYGASGNWLRRKFILFEGSCLFLKKLTVLTRKLTSWEHLQENWLFMGKCNVLNLKVYCSWENWMFLLGRKCVLFLKTWLLVLCQQYSSNLLASEGMLTQSYLYVFGDKLHEHI